MDDTFLDEMDVIFHKIDRDNLRIYYVISRDGEILARWEFDREEVATHVDGQQATQASASNG